MTPLVRSIIGDARIVDETAARSIVAVLHPLEILAGLALGFALGFLALEIAHLAAVLP